MQLVKTMELITANPLAYNRAKGTDIEVHADVEVSPGIVLALVMGQWELVSLQENSLGHSGVLNLGLEDVNGVVIEEVVDSALARSEVLVGVFDDWFLEISEEAESLKE